MGPSGNSAPLMVPTGEVQLPTHAEILTLTLGQAAACTDGETYGTYGCSCRGGGSEGTCHERNKGLPQCIFRSATTGIASATVAPYIRLQGVNAQAAHVMHDAVEGHTPTRCEIARVGVRSGREAIVRQAGQITINTL